MSFCLRSWRWFCNCSAIGCCGFCFEYPHIFTDSEEIGYRTGGSFRGKRQPPAWRTLHMYQNATHDWASGESHVLGSSRASLFRFHVDVWCKLRELLSHLMTSVFSKAWIRVVEISEQRRSRTVGRATHAWSSNHWGPLLHLSCICRKLWVI